MLEEILQRLTDYLDGRSTYGGLELWVVANLKRIRDSGSVRAIEMAEKIDVDFILWGNGELTDEEFRQELSELRVRFGPVLPHRRL